MIVTFKLPHEYSYSSIKRWIGNFNGFQLIGARQLFHNRSEITVALKKRDELRKKISKNVSNLQKNKNTRKLSKKLERKLNKKRKAEYPPEEASF